MKTGWSTKATPAVICVYCCYTPKGLEKHSRSTSGRRCGLSTTYPHVPLRKRWKTTQILSIEPSHIAVAGQAAQEAFGSHIRQHIPPSTKVRRVRHPSWRYGNADEYYRRVQAQIASAFPDVQPGAGVVPLKKVMKRPVPPARILSSASPSPTVSVSQLMDWRLHIVQWLRKVDRPTDQSMKVWQVGSHGYQGPV